MPYLFGKHYSRRDLIEKTGSLDQIGSITAFEYSEGRAAGTKAIQLNNGVLSLTLLPSRCLDIASASYKGIPFGYMSKSGIRGPQYFQENREKGFLDNFFGGLLTTSGLNSIGSPSTVNGRSYGLHGEISNIPAESVSSSQRWSEDDLIMDVSAVMRQSRFYGEDLLFRREIRTTLGASSFCLRDTIENLDFSPVPVFLLYHINLGFPLVDKQSYISFPNIQSVVPRTPSAAAGINSAAQMAQPEPQREEECFYYFFKDKNVEVSLTNPKLGQSGLCMYLRYNTEQFPVFTEWKLLRSREYVCGFAPGTNRLEGRKSALENESVRWLQPMESITFETEFGIRDLAELL